MSKRMIAGTCALLLAACAPIALQAEDGAPPSCTDLLEREAKNFALEHRAEDGRLVPLTVFAPAKPGEYPLLAFSHGAFASPARYAAMLEPLAAAGFVVIAPMHVDSEEYPRGEGEPARPPHPVTWAGRTADMELALAPDAALRAALADRGLALEKGKVIALGHSYGALIAQLYGGAQAVEPDGTSVDRRMAEVDAVVAFSPPGPMPGLMAKDGWASLSAPALTITGTADVLPGFIDDWRAHVAAHEAAPVGARALWVGEGIDHYFGGSFGRPGEVGPEDARLFARALERTLSFMQAHLRDGGVQDAPACRVGEAIPGESYEEDAA
ncbi:alpha/beta hydrolase family protein [Erythrobacter sp.]|jgi:dienelactone hydrolase|uniref:alpha/beta hydrolase family protein n=1 Tax=Erythrobacter sp. TaxID=1042 RepID=UPI002EA146E8|nr:alpha/beta fold hydrolase [Erythrobacter sp.]